MCGLKKSEFKSTDDDSNDDHKELSRSGSRESSRDSVDPEGSQGRTRKERSKKLNLRTSNDGVPDLNATTESSTTPIHSPKLGDPHGTLRRAPAYRNVLEPLILSPRTQGSSPRLGGSGGSLSPRSESGVGAQLSPRSPRSTVEEGSSAGLTRARAVLAPPLLTH